MTTSNGLYLRKLELEQALFFFLRDIGISSAAVPARTTWNTYATYLASIIDDDCYVDD